jgi:Peptidase C13 family
MKRGAVIASAIALFGASASAQVAPDDIAAAKKGMSWEAGHDAGWFLTQHQRLDTALAALKPQRPGVVDAYVVVVGLDSDAVFTREATEAANVLSRRYDAAGRTILLASGSSSAPDGSPPNLAISLGAIASKMDKAEDVLILYTTAHGAPGIGIVYKDASHETTLSYGMIAPQRLGGMLDQLGIQRRMLLISACYSGQFVSLASPESIIVTAADSDRTSFGCAPGNDWTFFGDALINNELRKPQPFETAIKAASELIAGWEFDKSLIPSKPRSFMGNKAKAWLDPLEKRMPMAATSKVGRPAIEDNVQFKGH